MGYLRVMQTKAFLFVKPMSEKDGSDDLRWRHSNSESFFDFKNKIAWDWTTLKVSDF